MISLMTIDAIFGVALGAPGVGAFSATKLQAPVLLRKRP